MFKRLKVETRTTRSIATFTRPFTLFGYSDELPAGDYEVQYDEELQQGRQFSAYRRTGTFLTVPGKGVTAGHMEVRHITDADLETASLRSGESGA